MELDKHPRLKKAMNGFVTEFLKNPYKYVYEADLQVALAKSLDEVFKEEHIINKLASEGIDQQNGYDIGKVHREYPSKTPFDVVVLGDPDNSKDGLNKDGQYEDFYEQPVKYAIELKLIQLHCKGVIWADKSLGDCMNLFDKKKEVTNYSMQLTFCHSRNEVEMFLDGCNPDKRREGNRDWFDDLYRDLRNDKSIELCYLDIEKKEILSVMNKLGL